MRIFSDQVNKFRIRKGSFGSDDTIRNNGAFNIPLPSGPIALVIASDGVGGWEHVSASLPDRCLTWDEMNFIKDLFWREDEAVMQLHPPRSEYVNRHPYCLHLWKPVHAEIPLPPKILVG